MCRGGLTDDGAALAVSGQLVVEDDEEHGEAEHQRHLEGVALAAAQRQGEAHHVGQDDEDAGQHESDEGVEVFDGEFNLEGGWKEVGAQSETQLEHLIFALFTPGWQLQLTLALLLLCKV